MNSGELAKSTSLKYCNKVYSGHHKGKDFSSIQSFSNLFNQNCKPRDKKVCPVEV